MTAFYLCAAALAALVIVWVLRPLLRRVGSDGLQREAVNLAILKDQLAELDADRQAGILSDAQYAQARAELERRVLDEAQPAVAAAAQGGKWIAPALALLIVLGSAGLYAWRGMPQAIEPPAQMQFGPHEVEAMIEHLAQRMKENPEDLKGWGILARSYYTLGRYAEAAEAYAQLVERAPPQADLLADYADALAMAQGGNFLGKPTELAQQALKLEAQNWKALTILGAAAFEREDYTQAVHYWERLLAVVPPESEFAGQVRTGVDQARAKSGMAAAPSRGVAGRVSLSPQLKAQAAPEDMVFVFARPAAGPKMPLAVLRLKVKDLPATFELNDSHAMRPDAKLSQYASVVVGARISKSGNPLPQSGDLEGYSAAVKPGAKDLNITIDRRVP